MNITEFLEARIAEDEAVALAASPAPWKWEGDADEDEAFLYSANEESVLYAGGMHTQGFLYVSEADKTHIARHDPARVLAECAAKRWVLDTLRSYEPANEWDAETDMGKRGNNAAGAVRRMAAVYASPPDYRNEWKL